MILCFYVIIKAIKTLHTKCWWFTVKWHGINHKCECICGQ